MPTRRREAQKALNLLDLKKGQTLYELGCGDGRILTQAAERGLKVVGYELNPVLALVCWLQSLRYRGQIKIIWGNFWTADLSKADGVFVFLIDKYMNKLDNKLVQNNKPVKLVSYAFQIPGKKPSSSKGGLFLYKY